MCYRAHFGALSSLLPSIPQPYIAEIIRGAIKSIPKGENEAADAIGMSYSQKLRQLFSPRAFGIMRLRMAMK